jgi:dolichol-phosphate mannosyltransferase
MKLSIANPACNKEENVPKCVAELQTRFNDLAEAFRTAEVCDCGPYRASHFNITMEMSLGALIRRYAIAQAPIRRYGWTCGDTKLKLREMGRKYHCTVLMFYFQRRLISDDLVAERLAGDFARKKRVSDPEGRVQPLESELQEVRAVVAGECRSAPPSGAVSS